jgi:hypothetical protein
MPRRYYDYLPQFSVYHKISTIGSYVMAAGFFLTAYYLVHSLFRGKRAPMNPWGGNSLEWHTASPPPHDNFATTPVAEDPYDFSRLVHDAPRTAGGAAPTKGAGCDEPRARPHLQHHFDTPEQQFDAGKLGIWLFLATEILLFGGCSPRTRSTAGSTRRSSSTRTSSWTRS